MQYKMTYNPKVRKFQADEKNFEQNFKFKI